MPSLILLLASIVPVEDVARESVDVLWVEHFYDEQGRLVFDQLIPLEWNTDYGCYDILCWRLIKCPSMVPQRDWGHGVYVVTFWDGEILRTVRAKSFRENWSQTDSELVAREWLPKERRRELRSVKAEVRQ